MSSFTKPLTITKIGSRLWKVERAFEYHVGSEDCDEAVKVPVGTTTDFASVPRIFWSLFPPDGRYTQAAVLHDYLYKVQIYTRKKSDYIFYEAMKVLKVKFWVRWIMHKAVRIGAWIPWNNYKKKLKKSG